MRRWITLLVIALSSNLFGSIELVDEAIAEARAQHQEKAFEIFLKALETPVSANNKVDSKERTLFLEGLELYLNPEGIRPELLAEEILESYQPVTANHPEYTLLNFIVASAYANKKEYDTFFWEFYRSYQNHPAHYLVDKTKAILHLRLMEQARLPVDREKHRQQVVAYLRNAAEKYPADLTLYRMILSLGTKEEKEGILKQSLTRILEENIRIPRGDVFPYVKDAVVLGEFELAQALIDRALEWYRYSRSINAAQKYLDQHRKHHG